jgi:hypothetical protein
MIFLGFVFYKIIERQQNPGYSWLKIYLDNSINIINILILDYFIIFIKKKKQVLIIIFLN